MSDERSRQSKNTRERLAPTTCCRHAMLCKVPDPHLLHNNESVSNNELNTYSADLALRSVASRLRSVALQDAARKFLYAN